MKKIMLILAFSVCTMNAETEKPIAIAALDATTSALSWLTPVIPTIARFLLIEKTNLVSTKYYPVLNAFTVMSTCYLLAYKAAGPVIAREIFIDVLLAYVARGILSAQWLKSFLLKIKFPSNRTPILEGLLVEKSDNISETAFGRMVIATVTTYLIARRNNLRIYRPVC